MIGPYLGGRSFATRVYDHEEASRLDGDGGRRRCGPRAWTVPRAKMSFSGGTPTWVRSNGSAPTTAARPGGRGCASRSRAGSRRTVHRAVRLATLGPRSPALVAQWREQRFPKNRVSQVRLRRGHAIVADVAGTVGGRTEARCLRVRPRHRCSVQLRRSVRRSRSTGGASRGRACRRPRGCGRLPSTAGTLRIVPTSPRRDPVSGLIDPDGLPRMLRVVREEVRAALHERAFLSSSAGIACPARSRAGGEERRRCPVRRRSRGRLATPARRPPARRQTWSSARARARAGRTCRRRSGRRSHAGPGRRRRRSPGCRRACVGWGRIDR